MTTPTSTLTVRWRDLADPLVHPLLDELAYERRSETDPPGLPTTD